MGIVMSCPVQIARSEIDQALQRRLGYELAQSLRAIQDGGLYDGQPVLVQIDDASVWTTPVWFGLLRPGCPRLLLADEGQQRFVLYDAEAGCALQACYVAEDAIMLEPAEINQVVSQLDDWSCATQLEFNWPPSEPDILDFLALQSHCMVSTVSPDGMPSGATVAFSAHQGLRVIFGTAETSRKFRHLETNPQVAVTVTDPVRRLTVQLQGRARQLAGTELAQYEPAHYSKLPGSRPFKDQPGETFWLVEPTTVQFSDCWPKPWLVHVLEYPVE